MGEEIGTPGEGRRHEACSATLCYQPTGWISGNITQKDTEHGLYSYSYDNTYQLTASDNPTLQDEAYTYDRVGNRQSSSQSGGTLWQYNQNNELQGYDSHSFVYDDNGSLTRKEEGGQPTLYRYNSQGRLDQVVLPTGQIAHYSYDPFGRRIKKDVSGQITWYLYTDQGLAGEYDQSGNLQTAYGWHPDGLWGTDPIYMLQNGQYHWYHNDHLGTPHRLTDGNGATTWSATYMAFGEAIPDISNSVTNNLRFPGQYFDAETGEHYNYFRYYNPSVGRYSKVDPIGFAGGVNVYGYVGNGATMMDDAFGLRPGDVYLFLGGDLAPYIAKFSEGPYGHAAIELSNNRFLSAGADDNGNLKIYIKSFGNELSGRSFDVFRSNRPINIDKLEELAEKLNGLNYLSGNVCSQTTSKGISVLFDDNNLFDWGKYLMQVSPNDIGTDEKFNEIFDWIKTVESIDDYYKIINPSGSHLSPEPR